MGLSTAISVMERLRLAALQGDAMTHLPMLVTPELEAWKTKEAEGWAGCTGFLGRLDGDRAIHWETLTAIALLRIGCRYHCAPSSRKSVKAH